MGKSKETLVKDWNECPLFMTVNEVSKYLGIGRPIVDRWFHSKDFPYINDGIHKVEKSHLQSWLRKKYAKGIYNNVEVPPDLLKPLVSEILHDLNQPIDNLFKNTKNKDELIVKIVR